MGQQQLTGQRIVSGLRSPQVSRHCRKWCKGRLHVRANAPAMIGGRPKKQRRCFGTWTRDRDGWVEVRCRQSHWIHKTGWPGWRGWRQWCLGKSCTVSDFMLTAEFLSHRKNCPTSINGVTNPDLFTFKLSQYKPQIWYNIASAQLWEVHQTGVRWRHGAIHCAEKIKNAFIKMR